MQRIRLLFLPLAVIVVGIHFFVTDSLRHSHPLDLKVLDGGQAFVAIQPSLEQEATNALATAKATIDSHVQKANTYRVGAGVAKWTGVAITAVMMLLAGFRGRVISPDAGQKAEELLSQLKYEAGKRKTFAVWVGVLSAAVAAATMIGSQLESEQASEREQAKDMHALYHTARGKLLEASTPSQIQDALKILDEIRLK